MQRVRTNIGLLVTALAVMALPLGTVASAAETSWPSCSATGNWSVEQLRAMARSGDIRAKLWGHMCGPHRVIRGVNYSYTVVVTNISDATYRVLKLVVSHYDPLTRASRPYRREAAANGDTHMKGAVWTRKRLKPGQSFRISFTLPFKQHQDPIGSNFDVVANGHGLQTYDVFFIRP